MIEGNFSPSLYLKRRVQGKVRVVLHATKNPFLPSRRPFEREYQVADVVSASPTSLNDKMETICGFKLMGYCCWLSSFCIKLPQFSIFGRCVDFCWIIFVTPSFITSICLTPSKTKRSPNNNGAIVLLPDSECMFLPSSAPSLIWRGGKSSVLAEMRGLASIDALIRTNFPRELRKVLIRKDFSQGMKSQGRGGPTNTDKITQAHQP